MLFSIIVPVYKVEKFLADCIESIIRQSYRDFELILVDDGSPDCCPLICDEYAKRDNRIIVIHQSNRGVSAARNAGLCAATGDYIVFVDSDDLLCGGMLKKLSNSINSNFFPDIIIGNIMLGGEKSREDNRHLIHKQTGKNLLELNELYAQFNMQLPWEACHSVYRRSFLADYGLYFQEGLIAAEDLEFYFRVIQSSKTYILTDIPFIYYRKRMDSIMNAPSTQAVYGMLTVYAKVIESVDIFPHPTFMRRYFANRYAKYILWICDLKEMEGQKKCYQFVNANQAVLNAAGGFPYNLAKAVWRVLGIRWGSRLLNVGRLMVKSLKKNLYSMP